MRTLLAVALAAGPVAAADPPAVPVPRLVRGDEFVYAGEADRGRRGAGRFRKTHDVGVRVLVLDVRAGGADCVILTSVQPRLDAVVAGPVAAVTGTDATRPPAAVRVDLVRIDGRGRVRALDPPPGLPVVLTADTPTTPVPRMPAGRVALAEVELFGPAADGPPPEVVGEGFWNGGGA